jgi:hypothetical protein
MHALAVAFQVNLVFVQTQPVLVGLEAAFAGQGIQNAYPPVATEKNCDVQLQVFDTG